MKKMALWIALLLPASLHAMQFELPLACTLGKDCFIQNYVDVDPGPGWSDFACGTLSYNGHDGTDFRVRDFVVMERGVSVLAAAEGVVQGLRDGEEDQGLQNPEAIKNKECGNGVRVVHADGWESQYCHLKKGSIAVHKGQNVKAGDVLGKIGYSGKTAFPHVHVAFRKGGKAYDPFTATPIGSTQKCGLDANTETLWKNATQIHYQPTALLNASFTTKEPEKEAVRRGKFFEGVMKPDAPMLIVWVDIMGVAAEDKLSIQVFAPDGTRVFQREEIFKAPKVLQFFYAGRKKQEGLKWQKGIYTGRATLTRKDQKIFQQPLQILVE